MRSDNSRHLSTPRNGGMNSLAPKLSLPCTISTAPRPRSPSKPSPITPESPDPGSTPKPTSKTRSGACAPTTGPDTPPRLPPGSAPATTRCASASTLRCAATANWPQRTSSCAANSPTLSANSGTPHPEHVTIPQQSAPAEPATNDIRQHVDDTVHDTKSQFRQTNRRTIPDNDRICCSQMDPVLGGIFVELQEHVGVGDDLGEPRGTWRRSRL